MHIYIYMFSSLGPSAHVGAQGCSCSSFLRRLVWCCRVCAVTCWSGLSLLLCQPRPWISCFLFSFGLLCGVAGCAWLLSRFDLLPGLPPRLLLRLSTSAKPLFICEGTISPFGILVWAATTTSLRPLWNSLDFVSLSPAVLPKLRILCVLLLPTLLIVPVLLIRRWAPLSCCLRLLDSQPPLPDLDLKAVTRSLLPFLPVRFISWLVRAASLVLLSLAVLGCCVLGLLVCGLGLFSKVVLLLPTGHPLWTSGRGSTLWLGLTVLTCLSSFVPLLPTGVPLDPWNLVTLSPVLPIRGWSKGLSVRSWIFWRHPLHLALIVCAMALDLTADGALSLSTLVTLEVDLQPYVLEWPSVPDSDGISEAQVLVVFKRQGGFLLAVPSGFIPQTVLDRANQGVEAGPVGASASVIVPGIIVDNVKSFTLPWWRPPGFKMVAWQHQNVVGSVHFLRVGVWKSLSRIQDRMMNNYEVWLGSTEVHAPFFWSWVFIF